MATFQITLPEELLQQAQQAGLLAPEALEKYVRDQLKAKAFDELFEAMEKMHAVDDPPYMSPEEIADSMREVRAEEKAKTQVCV